MKKIYYIDMEVSLSRNMFDKLEDLIEKSDLFKNFPKGGLCAIKCHMGEEGVYTYVHPLFIRLIYEKLKEKGLKPFLTDTVALYRGERMNAVDYLNLTKKHGFDFAPVIIADGLLGTDFVEVEIDAPNFKKVKIAKAIAEADAVCVVSHFTGHLITGFGGAIKNLGMGCTPREAKLKMHSQVKPYIDQEKCISCGICAKHCPADAIDYKSKKIIEEKCIGCAECIGACPQRAIRIKWEDDTRKVQELICEHALGVLKLQKPICFINFLIDITPLCDCAGTSGKLLCEDKGILAGFDPVAIDKASYDMICKEKDLFKEANPKTEPLIQIEYGEKIGLGKKDYEIIKIK